MTPAHVAFARSLIGVPYHHQGRNRIGLDCAGVPLFTGWSLGLPFVDLPAYGDEPYKDGMVKAVRTNLGEPVGSLVDRRHWQGRSPQVGDVVVMRFKKLPHHIGMIGDYLYGGLSLIHAAQVVGRVAEVRLDKVWQSRILEVYQWPA